MATEERGSDGSPDERAGLEEGGRGVVRGAWVRHASGRAASQRRRVQDPRAAPVRGGCSRQLEGAAHRGQREGLGDRAGSSRRDPVAGGADPAGDRELPRDRDRPPAGSPEVRPLLEELGALLPTERRASASIIEIIPEGAFVTYGLGVSLAKMRDPSAARSRVRVDP